MKNFKKIILVMGLGASSLLASCGTSTDKNGVPDYYDESDEYGYKQEKRLEKEIVDIIEGNGVRIYHAGDTLRYEGMLPKLRALGPVDAALLPINGRDAARYRRNCIGNMTFQESADLAGELGIRLALPGHWDMFADNPGDPQAFMDYLDAKYGKKVRCLIPEYGKPILITGNG